MTDATGDIAIAARRLEDVEDELASLEGWDEIRERLSRVRRDLVDAGLKREFERRKELPPTSGSVAAGISEPGAPVDDDRRDVQEDELEVVYLLVQEGRDYPDEPSRSRRLHGVFSSEEAALAALEEEVRRPLHRKFRIEPREVEVR